MSTAERILSANAAIKQKLGVVSVKDFGAKGDGITDDTACIANAITHLSNLGGGHLHFPAGTYLVNNIELVSNIQVTGSGLSSVIKLKNSATTPCNCFNLDGISNVSISDIQLDGNRTNNATTGPSADGNFNGMHIINCSDISINNIWSHSNGYHGCIIVTSSRIKIIDSKFTDNGYRPIHGHNAVLDTQIINNICYDNAKGFTNEVAGPYDGIYFYDGIKNLLIQGNTITSANSVGCIVIGGKYNGEAESKYISVVGNICTSGLPDSIHGIWMIGTLLKHVLIANNVIQNCSWGIGCDTAGGNLGFNIAIKDNIIDDCVYGVNLSIPASMVKIDGNHINSCAAGGIYVVSLTDSDINNNTLYENGAYTPANDGIHLSGTSLRNFITGNHVTNSYNTIFQKYGINEADVNCNYNVITNNYTYNMVTAGVRVQGANTVNANNYT